MLTLTAEARDAQTKAQTVRTAGNIPAVFYGAKEETTSISVPMGEFLKVWNEAGESTVITLKTPAGDKDALIHVVERHPVKDTPEHVDFYIIEAGKTVDVEVPLEFTGVAPAEKELGGVLVKVLHELHIEAMPKDLPHEVVVDISSLVDFESQITAKDIALPNGVTLLTDPEEVVAVVNEVKEEVEEAPAAIDMSAIEVEKKGKEEAPAEEGGEK